jgi:DNA repair exonuclease SbcCD ATPase subunit
MKIAHVKISNVLGIAELEFTPSGFNEISGPNGSGKTSVLEAIKATLNSGHDATLLRKGAEKGEAVLVLDDGTEIKKRVTEASSTTEVRRDGKKITRPAETIRALTDLLSVNPVDFLRAPKKDRVRVLLEAMPIEVDTAKLSEIAGITVRPVAGVHGLNIIETVYKQVYDERTGTNRAVREKQSTINQLRAAVPPVPAGADGDENELNDKLAVIDAAKDTELARISAKLDGIRKEIGEKIEDMRKQIDALNADFAEWERKAGAQRERAMSKHRDERAPILEQLAVIRNNREIGARRAQTLDTVANLETELEELTGDAERQTQALAGIEQYKSDLLDSLPIPGLEVKDGEIFRNGVQFDRLNTGQQVDVAVEIAKLRAGELGVVCVDGIELLDSGAFEEFRDRAIKSGLQLFVSKVSDDDFAINTAG